MRRLLSVQGDSFARSALGLALLDAQGQRLGLPVHALLGGAVRESLPVLWTLASGDAARDVEEALALVGARRHRVFKLKIGSRALADDIAHVQAIRRGLGDHVMLLLLAISRRARVAMGNEADVAPGANWQNCLTANLP
jgi:muconate cycloisomerase